MKALVIYDSVHGNTEAVARAMGDALAGSADVRVLSASQVSAAELRAVDLLLIGSPTLGGRPTAAIGKLLDGLPRDGLAGLRFASFDTRMDMLIARLFGYAGNRIAERLERAGATVASAPEGFIVKGREGPLREGERERAGAWAKGIAGQE